MLELSGAHPILHISRIRVNIRLNSCDILFFYFLKVPYDAEFFVSRFGIMAQNVQVAPNVIQEAMFRFVVQSC